MGDKRILVLSVSSWNSTVGSDTWPSLMSQYSKENVANICLREEIPDKSAAGQYFVISENRVLKSLTQRGIKTGYSVDFDSHDEEHGSDLRAHNERYAKMADKRSYPKLICREIVWKLGKWRTKELDEFIDSFSPDIILYFMEGYIHFNRICRYVKRRAKAKSIGFFVDDNFTYKQSKGLGFSIFRFLQRISLKKLVKKTDGFWAITKYTKEEADRAFNVDCAIVTKPVRGTPTYTYKECREPLKILYTGNLQIGRDRSLLKLVQALKEINRNGNKFEIDVYTKSSLDEKMMVALDCGYCRIHKPVSYLEAVKLQESADILLFLEDTDGDNAHTARLSFSAKITDYLSSSKCILAIGCPNTAPMRYFSDNDSAIVVSDAEDIIKKLKEITEDKSIIQAYAKNAVECGIKNHSKEKILSLVEESINGVLQG